MQVGARPGGGVLCNRTGERAASGRLCDAGQELFMKQAAAPHVVCIGLGCLDNRLFVDRFPPQRRRERVPKRSDALGGPAGVGAVTVARLGGKASFYGRRGDDASGREAARFLDDAGVDTSGFRVFPGAVSPRCEVFIRPDGERFLFPSWGEGLPSEANWLPGDAAGEAQALLIDGRWVEGGLRLAEQALPRGLPIVLDFDIDTTSVWELARLSTHVIADEDMAAAHGGVESCIATIEALGAWGAVTLGEQGAAHADGRIPAFPVTVVDSTGAGDVFHGAFALSMAQGRDEMTALRFSAAAGALRCKLGRVPYLDEVEDLLGS